MANLASSECRMRLLSAAGRKQTTRTGIALVVLAVILVARMDWQPMPQLDKTRTKRSGSMHHYDYEPPKSPIIAYATQGPAKDFRLLRDRFEAVFPEDTYRLFYHSFDEDCEGCLFQEKTSFAQGKNIVIKAVVTSEEFNRIKYVASFDNDAPVFLHRTPANDHNGWQTFHELLLDPNTTHPFIKPRYMHHDMHDKGTTYQSCSDENFWVIRKDHLDVVYPHSTYQQHIHHMNAYRVYYLLERCYPAAIMVHSEFATKNPTHSIPTKNYGTQLEMHRMAVDILQANYSALGPWDGVDPGLNHRCTVKTTPSIGLNPACKEVMEDRFQRWISEELEP